MHNLISKKLLLKNTFYAKWLIKIIINLSDSFKIMRKKNVKNYVYKTNIGVYKTLFFLD